jgi:tetratricopeptide (TPR) repeat protein
MRARELSELFEHLLEEMPPISLGRNDPCLCGSGKKYKKCCLGKERNPPTTEVRSESFTIRTNALTPEESRNNYPPLTEEDEELISDLYHDLHEYPESIDSEECDYFQELARISHTFSEQIAALPTEIAVQMGEDSVRATRPHPSEQQDRHAECASCQRKCEKFGLGMLRLKYPDHPVILNYIANGYQCLGQQKKAMEIITETYKKFPDYLFAQTALANAYLEDGLPEKALEVVKGAYTLKQLYPLRDVFHISEVRAFECFMVRYFCEIKDFKQAEIHLQIMEQALEADDVLLQNAQKRFKRARGLYHFAGRMRRLLSLDKK